MPAVDRAERTAALVRAHRAFKAHSRRRKVPKQLPPVALRREYAAALVRIAGLMRPAFLEALAGLRPLVEAAARDRRHDAYNPDQPRDERGRWGEGGSGGGETGVPRSGKDAAARIATAIDRTSAGKPGYPGREKVEKNWAKKISTAGIPDTEFHAVDRAMAENAANPEFSALKEKYGPEVVVLSNPFEGGGRGRAERLGTTTLIYHSKIAEMTTRNEAPDPRATTTEAWGGTGATLRHEYGHTIYDQVVKGPGRERWDQIKPEDPSVISSYARLKDDELFAETVAVVTSPKFDPGRWAPAEQRYFEDFRELIGLPARRADGLPARPMGAGMPEGEVARTDATNRRSLDQQCTDGLNTIRAYGVFGDQEFEHRAEPVDGLHTTSLTTSTENARLDIGEGPRARELIERMKARMSEAVDRARIEDLARKFAVQTATYQRIQLARQVKAALGVDVFLGDDRLVALVDGFVHENAALIRNIPAKLASDVELTVNRAMQAGKLWPDLATELEQKLGFAEDRARLIARDQSGKWYGQVNASRQQELGVTRFVWRTVADDRVRGDPDGKYPKAEPSHYERNGKTYEYADPPDGELPGEPVNCRCWADPVLDDILNAI